RRHQRPPAARGHRDGTRGPARLLRAFLPSGSVRSPCLGGCSPIRWAGDGDGRDRQHRGHPVPPGEEPNAGLAAPFQLPEMVAMTPWQSALILHLILSPNRLFWLTFWA